MPEYFTPDAYVDEDPSGPSAIEGVNTSIAALVGLTKRGPTNRACTVQSEAAYREVFGAITEDAPLSLAAHQFFRNGGKRAIIVRVKQGGKKGNEKLNPKAIIGNAENREGLHALDVDESIGVLLTPDVSRMNLRSADQVSRGTLEFCATRRIFHLLEIPEGTLSRNIDTVVAWARRNGQLGSVNAAVYFPSLNIPDPARSDRSLSVSPSGSMAGVIARMDVARGVWKAPAGISASIRNVNSLEFGTNRRTISKLQDVNINSIIQLPSDAIVAWAAWTFQSEKNEDQYKYIPVRRLFLFVEDSLKRGLQWVVFEPNDEALWAQIRLNISSFMNLLFRSGAFQGVVPRDAYYVRCDAETTSQADINLGRVNIEVGFAPVRPGEFVILKIQHKTADS